MTYGFVLLGARQRSLCRAQVMEEEDHLTFDQLSESQDPPERHVWKVTSFYKPVPSPTLIEDIL